MRCVRGDSVRFAYTTLASGSATEHLLLELVVTVPLLPFLGICVADIGLDALSSDSKQVMSDQRSV